MRGHITKRSKGSWSIVLDQGKDPTTGKRRQQWISVKGTKKDAERRLTELLGQVDTGVPIDNSRLGLGEYLETWLRDVVAARTRPRTADSYAAIVKRPGYHPSLKAPSWRCGAYGSISPSSWPNRQHCQACPCRALESFERRHAQGAGPPQRLPGCGNTKDRSI